MSFPPGSYSNTSGDLTATVGAVTLTSSPSSDTLVVVSPKLSFEKEFDPSVSFVAPGDTVDVTFRITDDSGVGGPLNTSAIGFSDNLDAFFSGTTLDSTVSDGCGGSVGGVGTGTFSYTGGTLTQGGSCEVVVTLRLGTTGTNGVITNTTSAVTGTAAGVAFTGPSASDTLTISDNAPLGFTKAFSDEVLLGGETIDLTFTFDNTANAAAATIVSVSDDLRGMASGITAGAETVNTCGATVSRFSGSSFISVNGGTVPAGGSCEITLPVTLPGNLAVRSYFNTTSVLSHTIDGVSLVTPAATDSFQIIDLPVTLTKAFVDDIVQPGDMATVVFTVENPVVNGVSEDVTDITFTDDFDVMIPGATFVSETANTCGAVTATAGGASLYNNTAFDLLAGASCTITVEVAIPGSTSDGIYTNAATTLTGLVRGTALPGEDAIDTITVSSIVEPTFSKSFDGPVAAGGQATLTFTLTNPGTVALSGLRFSDDLDAMLTGAVATSLPSLPCGASSTASGTGFLTFTELELAAGGGTCSFNVGVTIPASAAPGTYTNTTSALSNGSVDLTGAASDTLSVEPAPTFTKVFGPDVAAAGATTTLTFTVDNSASALAAAALDFTDSLPAGLLVASPANASTTCTGGTLTAVAGGGSITYTGGTIAAGATCTVSADVSAATAGDYVNTTGDLTSSSGNSGAASDTLRVNPQPAFAKGFAPDVIATIDVSTLTFTIDNSGSTVAATSVDFTDTLPSGVVVATPSNASTTCTGGTVTAVNGTTSVSYTGGTAAAAGSCTVSVDVSAASAGSYANTSGDLTTSLGNSGTASHTLTVVPAPAFTKQFLTDTIAVGTTSSLRFTIDNSASTLPVAAATFTDTLPAGLQVASPANASNGCAGAVTATNGTGVISLSAGAVGAGGNCVIDVDVTPTAAGSLVNLTGDLTSSLGNSGTATDTLTAVPAPLFSKAFSPSTVPFNYFVDQNSQASTSTLTFTIDNTAGVLAATSLDFTDNLPAGLVVETPANVTNDCIGGTVTATSGTSVVSYTGGTLAASATCTISVDVTPTAIGPFSNTSGDLTSSLGNSGTAAAVLATIAPEADFQTPGGTVISAGSTVDAGAAVPAGVQQTVTIQVTNTGTDSLVLGSISTLTPSANIVSINAVDGTGPLAPTESRDFTVQFTVGSATGTIPPAGEAFSFDVRYLGGNDLDENDFTFTVSGTVVDTVAPTGYSASFDQDPVNDGNETAVSFTFAGAEVGATYLYRIDSSAGSGFATGTGTIATATDQITGIDVSGVEDGTLTLSVTLTDSAGNASPRATATTTKDATAPAGYTVAFDQDPVNSLNETTVSFSFSNVEVGATFTYEISSTGGGTPVAGSGTAGTATHQVTGLDVSGLIDGTLTLTVSVTDTSGNTGLDASDTATKDATAPSLTIDAPIENDDVINAAEAPAAVISGTSTDLLDGTTVTISVTDTAAGNVTGTTTVTSGIWSITLDVSGLTDSTLTVTANASDAAGNAAPQVSATATLDTTAPAGYTAAFDQDPVNIANETAVSFTFAGAEVGATYAYEITSDGGGTAVAGTGTIATATDQITGLDLSGLSDGTLTLTVALTDPAGNTGLDASDTATKDANAPTATLTGPVTSQSGAFSVDLVFSEDVFGLALTSLDIDNGAASALTGSGTTYSFTVTPDHDGPITIELLAASAADAAGNPAGGDGPIDVTAHLTGTPNPTPLPDADGDGIADILEGTGDRDGDGIPDDEDFDPQGYFYCEADGRIIPGGSFSVSGPLGSNATLGISNGINITRDGSTGEMQWFALVPGTFTMSVTYPTAVGIPSTTRLPSGTLDMTTLLPANPAFLGSSENGSTGFLADASLAANPVFYTSFTIEPGDPFVLANNFPMTQCAPNAVTLGAIVNGAEANGGTPTDATFTVEQARLSTVNTVVSYSVAGSATSGSDFTALSGTVTIPAGSTSATITVPVLEDGTVEGTETVAITLTGVTGDLSTLLGTTVSGTANITDDDFASIAVTNVDLVTNEGGNDDATMTFVLLGMPTAPVTLSFAGDSQCNVLPGTLTFTAANYATPQALTVRAIDDDKVEGTHSCQPTVSVASADAGFNGLALTLATVTVTDDLVDQIREPLTTILEEDLEKTIETQQKSFNRMAKGALQRLQSGQDLPCGVLQGFDIDGSLEIQDATGSANGTFGSDVYNCATNRREILDGSFTLNKTEDTGLQALIQMAFQREKFVTENALAGYFLGAYFSRTDVSGLGEGTIDGFGFNGGLYSARKFGGGLFLDYYLAAAAGKHRYDIDFDVAPASINARGDYGYIAGFGGLGISGQRDYDRFVLKPRVAIDLAYAKAGEADVTARQLGLTHTGVIDLDDFSGTRLTAEVTFESLAAAGGSEALSAMMRTAITPRFLCEFSSFDSDAECGVGLGFAWERTNAASGLSFGIEVDVEATDDTRSLTFNLKRERMVFNGLGSVVSRLSMPAMQEVRVEHGIKLDW